MECAESILIAILIASTFWISIFTSWLILFRHLQICRRASSKIIACCCCSICNGKSKELVSNLNDLHKDSKFIDDQTTTSVNTSNNNVTQTQTTFTKKKHDDKQKELTVNQCTNGFGSSDIIIIAESGKSESKHDVNIIKSSHNHLQLENSKNTHSNDYKTEHNTHISHNSSTSKSEVRLPQKVLFPIGSTHPNVTSMNESERWLQFFCAKIINTCAFDNLLYISKQLSHNTFLHKKTNTYDTAK